MGLVLFKIGSLILASLLRVYNKSLKFSSYLNTMADVHSEVIEKLWYATPQSSWMSLREGLNKLWSQRVIDTSQYEDIEYAVDRLEKLNIEFPTSAAELHSRMDHYM